MISYETSDLVVPGVGRLARFVRWCKPDLEVGRRGPPAGLVELAVEAEAHGMEAGGDLVERLTGEGFICTSGKGEDLYKDKLIPAMKEGAEAAGKNPDDVEKMIEIKISYDTDPALALENTRFWAPLSLTAEQKHSIDDPIEMEKAADALPIDQVAKRWIVGSRRGRQQGQGLAHDLLWATASRAGATGQRPDRPAAQRGTGAVDHPEKVSDLAAFVASDHAECITGTAIAGRRGGCRCGGEDCQLNKSTIFLFFKSSPSSVVAAVSMC